MKELVGIVVGGRATGTWLPKAAKQLGFQVVHLYPEGLPSSITSTFIDEDYDFPKIVYRRDDRVAAAEKLRRLAQAHGLRLAGFVPGMDSAVVDTDWFASHFDLLGNSTSVDRSHKGILNERLKQQKIPVANTQTLSRKQSHDRATWLTFPLFMKPANSWGSIGAGVVRSAGELREKLAMLSDDSIVFQDYLNPDNIFFVDTISTKTRRVVTGVWLDIRGNDFPKEVWDVAYLMPPPALLSPTHKKLFENLLEANERVLAASDVSVGATHLEFMAASSNVQEAFDLKPTDLNLRLVGVRAPHAEKRATGVDPYALEILSRTKPAELDEIESLYSRWSEFVGLVFLRAPHPSIVKAEGRDWLDSLHSQTGARVTDILLPPAGTEVEKTRDGSTMLGVVHIAGPTAESIEQLYRRIRAREREGLFSEPNLTKIRRIS